MPHVSLEVLLPVYNAEGFLAETLESLFAQTYSAFEIIAVNDGSTDQSAHILNEYSKKDSRLRVYHRANEGLIKSLHFAIDISRAPFLARQDADDLSVPERFQKQMDFLREHENHVLIASYMEIFSSIVGAPLKVIHPIYHEQIIEAFLYGNVIPHGSVLMRREALLRAANYRDKEEAVLVEDYDLWLRLSEIGKVALLPEVLYRYREHPSSLSFKKAKLQEERSQALAEKVRRQNSWWLSVHSVPGFKDSNLSRVPSSLTSSEKIIYREKCAQIYLRSLGYYRHKNLLWCFKMIYSAFKMSPVFTLKWIKNI